MRALIEDPCTWPVVDLMLVYAHVRDYRRFLHWWELTRRPIMHRLLVHVFWEWSWIGGKTKAQGPGWVGEAPLTESGSPNVKVRQGVGENTCPEFEENRLGKLVWGCKRRNASGSLRQDQRHPFAHKLETQERGQPLRTSATRADGNGALLGLVCFPIVAFSSCYGVLDLPTAEQGRDRATAALYG